MQITFSGVAFAYDAGGALLLEGVQLTLPRGWTGVVGANGAGKSTLLKLATGTLLPTQGAINAPKDARYCPQRTDHPPDGLDAFFSAADGAAHKLQGVLQLDPAWVQRWDTLSHGERKRLQIAVALWRAPAVLAVDEPTNHLDAAARDLLADALAAYRGVGVLVSHDRQLLDRLCAQCLFVAPPRVTARPGGYSQGEADAQREAEATHAEFEAAQAQYRRLERELQRRRELASRSAKRVSKRGLHKKDHDAKNKIDQARLTGKDAVGGRSVRQMEGRLAQSQQRLEAIERSKRSRLGIWMPGEVSQRDALINLPAGTLALGGGRALGYPDLVMRPSDRVALTGPNGAGKSTLVTYLIENLNLEIQRVVFLPQEIALLDARRVLDEARQLPKDVLGSTMDVVSRLGSQPQRLLDSHTPSPGEIRKLLLAVGIARHPHLIVMDEPTNHLDLPAILCLENALSNCPCGLLLISHDRRFLEKLAQTEWRLAPRGEEGFDLTILRMHV